MSASLSELLDEIATGDDEEQTLPPTEVIEEDAFLPEKNDALIEQVETTQRQNQLLATVAEMPLLDKSTALEAMSAFANIPPVTRGKLTEVASAINREVIEEVIGPHARTVATPELLEYLSQVIDRVPAIERSLRVSTEALDPLLDRTLTPLYQPLYFHLTVKRIDFMVDSVQWRDHLSTTDAEQATVRIIEDLEAKWLDVIFGEGFLEFYCFIHPASGHSRATLRVSPSKTYDLLQLFRQMVKASQEVIRCFQETAQRFANSADVPESVAVELSRQVSGVYRAGEIARVAEKLLGKKGGFLDRIGVFIDAL